MGGKPAETMVTGMELSITEQVAVRLVMAKAKAGHVTGLMNCLLRYYGVTLQYIVYTNYLINVLTFVWHQIYWARGIINPIPKDSSTVRRDPLNHRGKTLSSYVQMLLLKMNKMAIGKGESAKIICLLSLLS